MIRIDKSRHLGVSNQYNLLDVPAAVFYYSLHKDASYDEELMEQINKQCVTPFYAVSKMTEHRFYIDIKKKMCIA